MKYYYKLFLLLFTLIILSHFYINNDVQDFDTASSKYYDRDSEFLINTSNCKIENFNPYSVELKQFVYKMNPISCSDKELISKIIVEDDQAILRINSSLFSSYSYFNVSCCYSNITRDLTADVPDDTLIYSECQPITANDTVVTSDLIRVECSNMLQTVYSNVHQIVVNLRRMPVEEDITKNAPSILMIGFDGISRLNLMRTMPKTTDYLYSNDWINLKGLNKVADNTFPNLMAVLTGMDLDNPKDLCNPRKKGALDECPFIWKTFKQFNYTTAFAEDTPEIATFNYMKDGFQNAPTDLYLRPYFLSGQTLSSSIHCFRYYCTGLEKTANRMFNLIKDYQRLLADRPKFGFFWLNTFSHDRLNCPSTMDEETVQFFQSIMQEGLLDNTIVFFFSDHGFRFGKIRLTHVGYTEERLPYFYMWLPKNKFPKEYKALRDNSNKLISHYDIYLTLQDILSFTFPGYVGKPSKACPKCVSLFDKVPENRTCEDAGIDSYWCSCVKYHPINKDTEIVRKIALFLVEKINNMITADKDASRCAFYLLDQIVNAQSRKLQQTNEENYLVVFHTFPLATFEATVKVTYLGPGNPVFELVESISRLDRYGPWTYCVPHSSIRKYCYCRSVFMQITNVLCNNFFCLI